MDRASDSTGKVCFDSDVDSVGYGDAAECDADVGRPPIALNTRRLPTECA